MPNIDYTLLVAVVGTGYAIYSAYLQRRQVRMMEAQIESQGIPAPPPSQWRGWLRKYREISVMAVLVVLVWIPFVVGHWPPETFKEMRQKWLAYEYKEVWNQTFINVGVPLDGYHYRESVFENVTFIYNGTAPVKLDNCRLRGRAKLESGFPPIVMTFIVQNQLKRLSPDGQLEYGSRPQMPWEENLPKPKY
jgi:hypothetical protein